MIIAISLAILLILSITIFICYTRCRKQKKQLKLQKKTLLEEKQNKEAMEKFNQETLSSDLEP